ncbi:MAG: hypothetical protein HY897_12065 [Deltaproteobacteria bacterium]|nr:hypothetical protein [Deltaproteobacteria bacterium]
MFALLSAAASAGCDENECESLAQALCEYESFKTDKEDALAKQRSDDCKCFTEGADSLETNPAIMRCVSLLEHVSALTGGSEFGIATLHACRAAHNQLDEYQDRYIEVCIQTDGTKECRNTLEACSEDCPDECKEECPGEDPEDCTDCQNACFMECNIKYPCNSMCIDFDFTDFVPEVNPGNGGGGGGGGGDNCSLECSGETITYSCATPDSETAFTYCENGAMQSATVTYSNGHTITCNFGCSGSGGTCHDDTGETCSL